MAARSSGIFVREGFNLDEEMLVPTSGTVPANLYHAKTIRVIGINVSGTDLVATIGGQAVALSDADADPNGVVIAHVRGALCDDPANTVEYALTGAGATVGGVFYDEAFHELCSDAAHRQDAPSLCMVCFSTRPPPDRITQNA